MVENQITRLPLLHHNLPLLYCKLFCELHSSSSCELLHTAAQSSRFTSGAVRRDDHALQRCCIAPKHNPGQGLTGAERYRLRDSMYSIPWPLETPIVRVLTDPRPAAAGRGKSARFPPHA